MLKGEGSSSFVFYALYPILRALCANKKRNETKRNETKRNETQNRQARSPRCKEWHGVIAWLMRACALLLLLLLCRRQSAEARASPVPGGPAAEARGTNSASWRAVCLPSATRRVGTAALCLRHSSSRSRSAHARISHGTAAVPFEHSRYTLQVLTTNNRI